jgi:ribosome biogenesis GTPase A
LDSCKSQNKDDIGEEEKDSAATKLMTILFKYGAKFLEKKQQEQIVVGVIGFTNVGKSSLINQLKQKIVCHTGSSPFIT